MTSGYPHRRYGVWYGACYTSEMEEEKENLLLFPEVLVALVFLAVSYLFKLEDMRAFARRIIGSLK
jgi:hypothetical protein